MAKRQKIDQQQLNDAWWHLFSTAELAIALLQDTGWPKLTADLTQAINGVRVAYGRPRLPTEIEDTRDEVNRYHQLWRDAQTKLLRLETELVNRKTEADDA
jgi:hypothetical protein